MERRHLSISILLLIASTAGFVTGTMCPGDVSAGQNGTFTGSWVANGTREFFAFGEERKVSLFKLSGHVNLKDVLGKDSDFWSECVGLADSETGSNVRCVWRSLDDEEIYLTLQASSLAQKTQVTGTFVGGTGSVKGITGTLSFEWSSMSFHREKDSTTVGGFAKNLTGSFKLP